MGHSLPTSYCLQRFLHGTEENCAVLANVCPQAGLQAGSRHGECPAVPSPVPQALPSPSRLRTHQPMGDRRPIAARPGTHGAWRKHTIRSASQKREPKQAANLACCHSTLGHLQAGSSAASRVTQEQNLWLRWASQREEKPSRRGAATGQAGLSSLPLSQRRDP